MILTVRSQRIAVPLILALTCGVARAAAPFTGGLVTQDYKIQTDTTNSNLNSGAFSMPHAVRFYRPGTDATADRATGNFKNGTATLVGNVVVHDSGNAPEAGADGAYGGSGTATLTCDKLDIDSKQKLYTATGHVHFLQGTRTATAERGVLNRAVGLLHLEGDVHLTDSGSTLVANVVDYNLNSKDAEVRGGPATLTEQGGVSQPGARPAPGAAKPHKNPQ